MTSDLLPKITRLITSPIVRPIVRAITASVGGGGGVGGYSVLDEATGALVAGTTFTRGTTATYFDSAGVMQTAAANAPRYDYQAASTGGTNGVYRGLLIESQKTNSCLQSADFTNASWTKTNVTATGDTLADPFGTTTADTLAATLANGTAQQAVTTTAINWTFSVYLRRKTGVGTVNISMDGTTWVAVTLTGALKRFEVTQTGVAGTSNPGIQITTSGDEVYAWGAQAEAGAFASSHIPTTTTTVTRAREIATIPLATIGYNSAGSTAFAEFTPIRATTSMGIIGTGGAGRFAYTSGGAIAVYDGTTPINSGVSPVTLTVCKVASCFGAAGQQISANNTAAVSGAYDGTWDVTSSLFYIGAYDNASNLDGWVRRARYYPTQYSAAALQALTV